MLVHSYTEKSAGVRDAICKQYNSKEGTSSDEIADSNRVKSCSEPASEETVK